MELIKPYVISLLYESIHDGFIFVVFFSLLCLLIIIVMLITLVFLKKRFFHCKCEICHTYVTSEWKKEFLNISDWYTYLLQKSPSNTIHIHVLGNIITANPKNVEHMLKTNFNNYPKGKPFSTILGDLLGQGIFNVDGDAWRFQKKMARLELNKQSVRSFSFQVVKDEIQDNLIPYLYNKKEGEVMDLQEIFKAFSLSTISKFSFGVKFETLHDELVDPFKDFSASFDLATKLSAGRALEVFPITWRLKRFFGIGKEKRLRDMIKKIDDVAMEIIKQRRNHLLNSSSLITRKKDLLSRFMETVSDDSDRYLRDIIVSFLLAGRDTMASALTSFFWLMAQHPRVESNILLEADRVLGQDHQGGVPMFDQLGNLNYLQATIFESMRLYPPIQFDSKFALNNDVFPDMATKVMKGTRVTYHPYAMGRMEEIWGKDCLEFKPERWLKNGVFFNENPYKYPVFQAGVRVCLGKEMAIMEIKCVVLSLLREFHFELGDPLCKLPRFSSGLTATFNGGLPVILCTRIKP